MAIDVLDFSIEEDKVNPFAIVLHDPIFDILAYVNGNLRELTLKMSGEVTCPEISSLKDFEFESYRNYLMITEFLLGEQGENVRRNWGLSKDDFRELIFEMYFTLVKEHATCGFFKKALLIFIGIWKFFRGRKLR